MHSILVFVFSLLGFACCLLESSAQDSRNQSSQPAKARSLTEAQQTAVQRIRAAGGVIQFDKGRPHRIRFPERNATNDILPDVIALGRLASLDLTGCVITDDGLRQLQGVTIYQLHLAGTAISDKGMQHLAKMKELRLLNIENTNVSDTGLAHIAKLSYLGDVRLHGTQITNTGLRHLETMPAIWRLSIGGSGITDDGLVHISKLQRLSALTVHGSPITNAGLKHLQSLPRLRQLTLTNTKVTADGANELKQVRSELIVSVRVQPVAKPFAKNRQPPAKQKSTEPKRPTPTASTKSSSPIPTASPKSNRRTTSSPATPKRKQSVAAANTASSATTSISQTEAIQALKALGAKVEFQNGDPIRVSFTGDNKQITDDDLAVVATLTSLERLGLSRTSATDALLKRLTTLTRLRTLRLYKTNVTWIGIAELEKSLPGLKVSATPPSDRRPNKWMNIFAWILIPVFLLAMASFFVVAIRFIRMSLASGITTGDVASRLQAHSQNLRSLRNPLCMSIQFSCVFAFVIGMPFVFEGTLRAMTAHATATWPTVEGRVVVSRVIRRVGTGGGRSNFGISDNYIYIPIIVYQYEVDGTTYTGDRIAYYDLGNIVSKDADARYPLGQTTVYYNTNDPVDSVLQPGTGLENFTRIGLGAVFTIIGIIGFFVAHSKKDRTSTEDSNNLG